MRGAVTTWSAASATPIWRGGGTPWVIAGAIALAIGLAAALVHPALGLAVAGALTAPLFVAAPQHALLLFAAVVPFDAVSALEGEGAITVTRLLGVALIGGWMLSFLASGRRVRVTRAAWLLLGYVALAAVSLGWAADPMVTLRALATLVQLLLLSIMAANVLRSVHDVRRLLDVLLVATAVLAVLVLWELPPNAKRATFTLGGETVSSNYLAATLVFPLVAAVGLGSRNGAFGWWRWAAVLPIALALLLTGSRGGAIAAAAGLLTLGILRRRLGLWLAVCAIVVAVLLPVVVPHQTLDRLWARYAAAEQDRLSGRVDIWRVAFAMAEDRPLQGTAFGGFQDAFYHYMLSARVDPEFARIHSRGNRAAHNIYLGTLAELGVGGLALLVAALTAQARALLRAGRAARAAGDSALERILLALGAAFVSLVVFGSTIDLLATKQAWLWLGAMQGAVCIAPRPGRGRRR